MQFIELMSSCVPVCTRLLGSKVNTDVLEALEFLATAFEFQVSVPVWVGVHKETVLQRTITCLFPSSLTISFYPQLRSTVEPMNHGGKHFVHCSEVAPSSDVEMYGQYIGRGANSVSIVGRLSTLRSVHYQRFHCKVSLFTCPHFPTNLFPVRSRDQERE